MAFDYRKLRGKIREVFDTQENFAKAMIMGTTSLSAKLNNYVQWTQSEIDRACTLLEIKDDEITVYFFTKQVQITEQK